MIIFLSIVRTTELHPSKSNEDRDKLDSLGEYHELKVGNQASTAEIHSSFSEDSSVNEGAPPSLSSFEGQSVFQNIDVSPELSETTDAVVFTLIDTAAELKNRAEPVIEDEAQNSTKSQFIGHSEEVYIVRAEPKTEAQETMKYLQEKEVNKSEPVVKSSQEELSKTAPQHEDIPSFREWTQKQLAEAERKKVDQNSTITEKLNKPSGKFRIKNYASPDCGAKIVAANPESVSSSSVLSSSKDEYMLNYCTNRIWFVVELCEAIQAKQFDLANFELFSSSPKDFAVSISHRFPTRDWSNVGKFTAKDSRDIQTFNLNPHLFGRYIKVELLSHYGKEQFCPVSWVGVFGTSEFEVLAKEDERHAADDPDEDDEDLLIGQRRDAPKNLFISATDAVLSIVKKATAPFMKSESNETRGDSPESSEMLNKTQNCVTPRYITVCDNCSQSFYDEVYYILSCHTRTLTELIESPFVKRTLIDNDICRKFGLDFNSLRLGAPFPSNRAENHNKEVNYLTSLLKDSFVAALCNILAVAENRVVVNASSDAMQSLKNLTEKNTPCLPTELPETTPSCGANCKKSSHSESSVSKTKNSKDYFLTEILRPSEQFSEKIEPTKTLNEEEVRMLPSSEPVTETTEMKSTSSTPTNGKATHTVTVSPTKEAELTEATETKEDIKVADKKDEMKELDNQIANQSNITNQDSTFDSILSDINEFEKAVHSNPTSNLPRVTNLPTESIFLRLAHRIKNLEINMSLSSTYLEELSRRYRNQLEMLSKTINITAQKIEERYKLEEERERLREKEILLLRLQLANLTRDMSNLLKEKNSWRPRASSISQHIVLVSIEIFFVWVIFSCWRRKEEPAKNVTIQIRKKVKRRKSLEGVTGHNLPLRRKRRPSDEALEIALARNHNLPSLKLEKKRKRKKKDSKCSINLIQVKRKKSDSNGSSEEVVTQPASPPPAVVEPEVETANRFAPFSSPETRPVQQEAPSEEKVYAPVFIKTAMASRNARLRFPVPEKEASQESSVERCELLEESLVPPREKKSSGATLKKYMKKFFDK
ncbi:UNVERIFIED_CONTAM: hypothetical protein PYX00_006808 [Menopon gallinae]|uniref:SUN domain-containing protein n=1 Tax=Menopon gallinae TaxID=328185 RepID=A0AAW2HXQ3_9NEOP